MSKYFKVMGHLEESNYGVSTTRANFKGLPIWVGTKEWPIQDLVDTTTIDLVYGNPPCAAWSGNNRKSSTHWRTDGRVSCTRRHFGLLETVKPKIWIWESVCQAPIKGKEFVDELVSKAIKLGYSVSQVFHDAQYLGVPQIRKRWFMVCHRVEFKPDEPTWEVISAIDVLKRIKPTESRAYDVKQMKEFVEPRLKDIQPGARFRNVWSELDGPIGKTGSIPIGCGHVRLKGSGPSCATVGYAMAHPTQDRFLHVNEVAALAGFPPGYTFVGGAMGAQQLDLIARGVCPPVGEWIARAAARALKANVKVTKPRLTMYDYRKPPIKVA